MPNHVYNVLEIHGEEKELKKFLKKNNGSPEQPLDFNKAVKMPKGYDQNSKWYKWAVKHWGTKWNAYDIEITDDSKNGELIYRFQTAWSPPENWLRKLAKKWKTLEIEMCFEEEARMYPDGKFIAKGRQFKETKHKH